MDHLASLATRALSGEPDLTPFVLPVFPPPAVAEMARATVAQTASPEPPNPPVRPIDAPWAPIEVPQRPARTAVAATPTEHVDGDGPATEPPPVEADRTLDTEDEPEEPEPPSASERRETTNSEARRNRPGLEPRRPVRTAALRPVDPLRPATLIARRGGRLEADEMPVAHARQDGNLAAPYPPGPTETALEPTVHVSIGRIDVRAVAAAQPPRRHRPPRPRRTLDDFLAADS